MWPPHDVLLAAWRALAADPDAATAFADLAFDPLVADLGRRFPHADPAHPATAAGDALLALIRDPGRYNPDRCPLPGYLRHNASRDMLNLLAGDERHRRRRIPWEAVELGHPARNNEAEGDDLPSLDAPALAAVVADFTADERVAWELLLDEERDTAVFAAALGLAHLPPDDQRAAVYRLKDRIKQRLKRAGRKP